jgi:hypothetical protein
VTEIPINSENLVEHIRVLFPELEDEYEKAMSEWEGIGQTTSLAILFTHERSRINFEIGAWLY